MPFAFKRKETAQESMSRLLEDCVANALTQGKRDTFEAIHCARKQVKKARAVLRLFKHELNRKSLKIWLKALRKAAKVLASREGCIRHVKDIQRSGLVPNRSQDWIMLKRPPNSFEARVPGCHAPVRDRRLLEASKALPQDSEDKRFQTTPET